MVSSKVLLSTIESALLGPSPTPRQRIELIRAIRSHLPSLKSLLSYPTPKASDRSQVQWREVRLPDSGLISLDDQDVQIALKLSDDLNLNEIDCVGLLVCANQEWGLFGRDPLEIYRLAAGLWYTERRDLITALYILLRAVVLDQGLAVDLVANIQEILEDLFNSGLRQRMINLVKDLGREDSVGIGGPQAEPYVLDSKGALVERGAVVYRERLSLSHCMVLSTLIVRMSPTDVKDVFSVLKDCASIVNDGTDPIKLQIVFSHLFSLVITFISDALSAIPDKASVLSEDVSFRREFQELVMVSRNDPNVEGFVNGVRLAWVVHLMLTQDPSSAGETFSGASANDLSNIHSCLELLSSKNVFEFLLEKVLRTAAYQNDDGDMIYMYHAYMHKLIMCFLSHPLARDKFYVVSGLPGNKSTALKLKANWTPEFHGIFVRLCEEQVLAGNRPGTHLTKEGWKNVMDGFYKKTGLRYEKKQFKNHWDTTKDQWKTWNKLISNPETQLDLDTERVKASEEFWENYLHVHPEAALFRYKGLPLSNLLDNIFLETLRTSEVAKNGDMASAPQIDTSPNPESYPLQTVPSPVDNQRGSFHDMEIQAQKHGSPSFSLSDVDVVQILENETRDRRRKRNDPANAGCWCRRESPSARLDRQLTRLCEAFELRSQMALKEPNSINECIQILNEMADIPQGSDLYLFAVDVFLKKECREVFIALGLPDVRLAWLRRQYAHRGGPF